jgi:hypothetical protein
MTTSQKRIAQEKRLTEMKGEISELIESHLMMVLIAGVLSGGKIGGERKNELKELETQINRLIEIYDEQNAELETLKVLEELGMEVEA